MDLLHIFALINIAIFTKGWFTAVLFLMMGRPFMLMEDKESPIGGFLHGWFICSFLLLYYAHKLGFLEKKYPIVPYNTMGYNIGFLLGVLIELQGIISMVQKWNGQLYALSVFLYLTPCNTPLFAYSKNLPSRIGKFML